MLLDLTQNARIESCKWSLVAHNTTTDNVFTLEELDLDLSQTVVLPGAGGNPDYQQFQLNGSRGFQLGPTDIFNQVQLITTAATATQASVRCRVGFKVRWEEWLALPGADLVFFDIGEPNQGLNLKSSRYSGQNGYIIRVFLDLVMSNGVSLTNYQIRVGELSVLDYGDDGFANNEWDIPVLQTFDQSGFNLQGGIHSSENTKVVWTYEYQGVGTFGPLNTWGVNRIDIDNGGQFSISEISTLLQLDPNSPLIPLPGDTQCEIIIADPLVTLTCEIDHTKIQANQTSYALSTRLGGLQP